MADSIGASSSWTQANALMRKNLTFQRRNMKTNVRLVLSPLLLCLLLLVIQVLIDNVFGKLAKSGELQCDPKSSDNSTMEEGPPLDCHPPPAEVSLPLLQLQSRWHSAVVTDFIPHKDLPDESCKKARTCPVITLVTGNNQTLGLSVAKNMIPKSLNVDLSSVLGKQGTLLSYVEFIQPQCASGEAVPINITLGSVTKKIDMRCLQGLTLWRNSSRDINEELYKGYREGNPQKKINEILAAYDFMNSNEKLFNVTVWKNSTKRGEEDPEKLQPLAMTHVLRSINLASNAYLQHLLGQSTKVIFEYVNDMPKVESKTMMDISSLLGPLFFTWVIVQLFPVILTYLVYEKQQRLRLMMKMHGLGDGPYWMISYAYFLALSTLYMICFVGFGALIGLKIFTLNDYSIQFAFYFLYINLQVSLGFLTADWFSNVKTATVVGYMIVFGTGLLGGFLFQSFLEDASFPKYGIIVLELYPGFALYRGLYEFAKFSGSGNGMRWTDLNDSEVGMIGAFVIIAVEWVVVLAVAFYADLVVSYGKSPISFSGKHQKKLSSTFQKPDMERQGSNVFVRMEKPDVEKEREKVEQLLVESDMSQTILCHNLKKIYPGRDGNPDKYAVREISLALPPGECFGMLGTNGAGKTSFISMMIGLTRPTSGLAYVQGLDIQTDMDKIYTSMGVCPQHDLLWETLTAREHLLFYGRLKNLKGAALTQAVEDSLKSVNLLNGGVADKQAAKYSGGMKRRLSVAISLIGDPKVVYMDEPSTGLDPASRNMLWNAVKQAKQNRAIVLTTHSMEEAEYLCDRLGIFVDGTLQCIGNPKELKGRYEGSYVFTMTTSPEHEEEVDSLVRNLSAHATKIYQISGTQKFELPKHEIRIADVFEAVEDAKSRFPVQAWGLADTTLEDVFIKVARGAQSHNDLS